jgi:hypothetical protein
MRINGEVVQKRTEIVEKICDICGTSCKTNCEWSDGKITNVNCFGPVSEKDWTINCEIDICPDCFEKVLIPWVQSFGKRKLILT